MAYTQKKPDNGQVLRVESMDPQIFEDLFAQQNKIVADLLKGLPAPNEKMMAHLFATQNRIVERFVTAMTTALNTQAAAAAKLTDRLERLADTEVHVSPEVEVNMPAPEIHVPAPQVNAPVTVEAQKRAKYRVERDNNGWITGITREPA